MKSISLNQRRWSRFGLILLAVVLTYALLTFLAWILGAVVVKRFPENFEWQVKSALRKGSLKQAENIARKRVQEEHYDFAAHRLLAEVMLQAKQPEKAVETLLMSLERMNAASGRQVYTRGADPVATYDLLTTALLQTGNVKFAHEVKGIAADYAEISSIADQSYDTAKLKETPSGQENPQGQEIPLPQLELKGGVTLTTSNTLHFSSAGSATTAIPNEDAVLHIQLAGGRALGIGSILKVLRGEETTFLAYGNNVKPRWVAVPLPHLDSQGSQQLTLQFINDAYDPVTGSDRNIEVFKVLLEKLDQ